MVNIKKLESTQALLAETRERTLNDSESWNDYILNAAVKFYKYSYEEQLLIHAQRPYATACAPYDLWNKQFQRYVMRHTKGIALLARMPDGSKGLRYVFDVSDTGGRRIEPLWRYMEEHEEAVKNALCETFRQDSLYPLNSLIRAACSSETFSWLADQNHLGPNTLRHLIERNAGVVVLERMGLRGRWMPEFNGIDGLDYEEAELLYRGINYVAGRILRTVEKTIKRERGLENGQAIHGGEREQLPGNGGSYDTRGRDGERRDGSEVHSGERDTIRPDRGLLRPGSEGGRGEAGTDRTLREGASEILGREQAGGSSQNVAGRQLERDAGTVERAGDGQNSRTYDGVGEEKPSAGQDEAAARVGGAHEHAQGTGDRDNNEGVDLRLDGNPAGGGPPAAALKKRRSKGNVQQLSLFPSEEEQRAAIEAQNTQNKTSTQILTEEFIDDFLCIGPMWADGKERIFNFFSENLNASLDVKERFLAEIYEGSKIDLDTADGQISLGKAEYDTNGIQLEILSYQRPREQRFVAWREAAGRIERIFRSGTYLAKNGPAEIWDVKDTKISQEDIDRVAAAGTGFSGSRRRIANIFAAHNSDITDELIEQLRKEYYDSQRLHIWLVPPSGRELLHNVSFYDDSITYHKTHVLTGDLRNSHAHLGAC